MGFRVLSNRFGFCVTGVLTLFFACPAYAAPPIGYVGDVSQMPAPVSMPAIAPLPIGYVGEVPQGAQTSPPPGIQAAAEEKKEHPGETFITAQQMHSDSANNLVTATGKVEIVRGDYVLHADKVIYNQTTGVMIADGHVAMLTPSGEVQFADHQEITGDMKQAFVANVGILFPDNSRMASRTAERYDERYTVANKAAYTACNICRDHPEQEPLWQLDAQTITHDNTEHELYYHDTTIDFAGVPIAYTPYLSGPDPTVKRLQGFLAPEPGVTSRIGTYIKTPYYVDIAPDKDMTITPTFSTTDIAQLDTQYRQRFDHGKLQLEGSTTYADLVNDTGYDEGKQWRGHLFGTFIDGLDPIWRIGSDVQYVSDKSYLDRYQISSLDQTTTRAYLEGFKNRDYLAVNSYYFQDLRPGTDVVEPLVLPSATFSALGDPGSTLGGRWSLDGNTLVTQRDNSGQPIAQQGPDTRRLSLNEGWERQLISQTGLVTTVSGLFRTDSYLANNVVSAENGQVYNNANFTRQFEQANIVMRYPMGRSGSFVGDGYQQLVEPIVAITAAPKVRQITEQPIEDSLDVEFDETNLFSPNRFTGSDLIEGGSRATYGLRNSFAMDSGSRVDVFGGESYNFTTDNQFPAQSGLTTRASDYVGRIDFVPVSWITANYGFRLSEQDFSPQQQDATLSFGTPLFKPTINYIEAYEDNNTTTTTSSFVGEVQQMTISLSSTFKKYWTLSGSHVQSFEPQPGPRSDGISLSYVDECFGAGINLSHDDTDRVDISSGTSVSFHFFLKNLGGIHTDSTGSQQFPSTFRQTDPPTLDQNF